VALTIDHIDSDASAGTQNHWPPSDMPDIVDPDTRSRMMASIRSVNTAPEMQVRRYLHARGFRYRLHDRRLPGRPDLVLPGRRAVIQVQGCFWHAHEGCRYFQVPATRRSFWEAKLLGNRDRDQRNERDMQILGWRVAIVWECALCPGQRDQLENLESWLNAGEQQHLELAGT